MNKLRSYLRRLLFNEQCIICRELLNINEDKLCPKCYKLLSYASIKKKDGTLYLWNVNKYTYSVYLEYLKKKGIVYNQVKDIIKERTAYLKEEEMLIFKPFRRSKIVL